MCAQEFELYELFKNPKHWKSINSIDIITKYANKALIDKQSFLNYLQHMFSYNPWVIKAFIMGAPNSVYNLKLFFKNELQYLQPTPKYNYGSQSLLQFLNDIDRIYENQTIYNSDIRKRILYKAAEVLNNDDYQVFCIIIKNEFEPKIYKYIEEFYNENNLPEKISKYFLFSFKTEALSTVNQDLFVNNTNSAIMYFPKGELQYHLIFNHTCIKLNDKFEKTLEDINSEFYKSILYLIKTITDPIIFIEDNNKLIGYINNKGVFLYSIDNLTTITEHVFSTKICQGLDSALIVDVSEKQPRVIGNISYKAGTLQKCTKQVSSFTTSIIPYCGYSASVITCQEKDTDNSFYVFALSEHANTLSKNLKNFKLASLLGRFFYMR